MSSSSSSSTTDATVTATAVAASDRHPLERLQRALHDELHVSPPAEASEPLAAATVAKDDAPAAEAYAIQRFQYSRDDVAVYSATKGLAFQLNAAIVQLFDDMHSTRLLQHTANDGNDDDGAAAATTNQSNVNYVYAKLLFYAGTGTDDSASVTVRDTLVRADDPYFVYYTAHDFLRHAVRWLAVQRFLTNELPTLNAALRTLLDRPEYRRQFVNEAGGSVFHPGFAALAKKWCITLSAALSSGSGAAASGNKAHTTKAQQQRHAAAAGDDPQQQPQRMGFRDAAEAFVRLSALYTRRFGREPDSPHTVRPLHAIALLALLNGNDGSAFGLHTPVGGTGAAALTAWFGSERSTVLSTLLSLAPNATYLAVKRTAAPEVQPSTVRKLYMHSVVANTGIALKQLIDQLAALMPPMGSAADLAQSDDSAFDALLANGNSSSSGVKK